MAAEDPEVLSKPPFLADIQLSPVRASGIWGGKEEQPSFPLSTEPQPSSRVCRVSQLDSIASSSSQCTFTYVRNYNISPLLLSTLPVLSYRGGTD